MPSSFNLSLSELTDIKPRLRLNRKFPSISNVSLINETRVTTRETNVKVSPSSATGPGALTWNTPLGTRVETDKGEEKWGGQTGRVQEKRQGRCAQTRRAAPRNQEREVNRGKNTQ